MQGTTSRLRTDSAARLAGLERDRPEWKTWLALLSAVERELEDDGWLVAAGALETPESRLPTPNAPLLQGRTLELDAPRLQRLVHRLADVAELGIYRPDQDEAARLVAAAVHEDLAEIAAIAERVGIEGGPLASIAHLAALPVLHACGRLLAERVPLGWSHGYCPICGAWPTLVERRGLDRSHWLRCARCAGAWEVQPLWCVYCGERDHRKLGSLVPEAAGETLKVDTCESCRGYLKSVATLQPIPAFELLLQDLETVELDLVAVERGYERPGRVASRQSPVAGLQPGVGDPHPERSEGSTGS